MNPLLYIGDWLDDLYYDMAEFQRSRTRPRNWISFWWQFHLFKKFRSIR